MNQTPQIPAESRKSGGRILLLIGAFKLFKAVLLAAAGIGALKLLHRDVAEELERWLYALRVDPYNHYIDAAIQKLGLLNDVQLKEISAGSFFYAGLLTIEGVGLLLKKHWAEYFTVIMTASLVPLEVIEIMHRLTPPRVVLLIVNLAILWYLIQRLRFERREKMALESNA